MKLKWSAFAGIWVLLVLMALIANVNDPPKTMRARDPRIKGKRSPKAGKGRLEVITKSLGEENHPKHVCGAEKKTEF